MSNPHNRHQLPPEKLSSYDACPIYATIGQKNQVGESDEIPTVGIEIRNWKIKSGKSRISSESECDLLARQLQNAATLDGTDMKRLNPPEIVYFHAFLTLEYPGGFCFSFTAREALLEWADAHKYLCSNTTCNDYRGVSITKSADAKLWKSKNNHCNIKVKNEFNYDWTYSTPFVGVTNGGTCNNGVTTWEKCDDSGINMTMLTDKSAPILMYDDILLYEDDMHDNGDVQLSVKIRVMPKCFYILMRLFLRVDHMLIRCRDTRIFHVFGNNYIYRDVTWRGASWNELNKLRLPDDVVAWTHDRCQALVGKLPLVELPSDLSQYSSASICRTDT